MDVMKQMRAVVKAVEVIPMTGLPVSSKTAMPTPTMKDSVTMLKIPIMKMETTLSVVIARVFFDERRDLIVITRSSNLHRGHA